MALREDLIEHLGLEAEATDEEILEAVDVAVAAAAAGDSEEEGESGSEGDAAARAARLPSNLVAVDRGAFDALQRNAKAGAEALALMNAQRREGIVAKAVREGRIAPASSAAWLASLERDEAGAAALIETLPANTIPVEEIGKSDGIESEDDELLSKMGVKIEGSSK